METAGVTGLQRINPPNDVVPNCVVTDTLPLVTLVGTTVVIALAFRIVNEDTATPPIVTFDAVEKLFPIIETVTPLPVFDGENELIVGG